MKREKPEAQKAKTFRADIWGQKVKHNKDVTWLREIKKGASTDFAGETEEDIEDSELEGPWTRWGTRVLAKELYQLMQLPSHCMSPIDMKTVDRDNY